jgi:hypothetical protein
VTEASVARMRESDTRDLRLSVLHHEIPDIAMLIRATALSDRI